MTGLCFYNEWDRHAAAWLRQLMRDGLIGQGVVDERSITEISPDELAGKQRVHLFAGIAGWELALRLAGWGDEPVWTASLPCQPFSVAGKQQGKADERHLLPHFLELVRGAKPGIIFGEQVPGAIKHGWLDDLCDHLEREGYTVRAAVLTASGAGAPHIRQRLYWCAFRPLDDTESQRRGVRHAEHDRAAHAPLDAPDDANGGAVHGQGQDARRLEDTGGAGQSPHVEAGELGSTIPERQSNTATGSSRDAAGGLANARPLGGRRRQGEQRPVGEDQAERQQEAIDAERRIQDSGLADGTGAGLQEQPMLGGVSRETAGDGSWQDVDGSGRLGDPEHDGHLASQVAGGDAQSIRESQTGQDCASELEGASASSALSRFVDVDWLWCRDGKHRPVEPGVKPLVDGLPKGVVRGGGQGAPFDANATSEARAMRLKGYGNAIQVDTAVLFIQAVMEFLCSTR